MIYAYKVIKIGHEARETLKKGIDIVAEIIGKTLGHGGKNVIIERKGLGWGRTGAPLIINDGYYTAQHIVLKDEIENLGAQSLIDVAVKTNGMVGDGTTTSIVLGHAIVDKIFKDLKDENLLAGGSVKKRHYYREIKSSCQNVVSKLKEMARPVKTRENLENVAIVSLENEEMGKIVAGMAWKVGKDGFINIEESEGTETKTDIIPGMKFEGTYVDESLVTNNRKEAILKDPMILVYNGRIEEYMMLKERICDWLMKNQKREVVIICEGYSREITPFVAVNKTRGVFYCLALKAPALTSERFEDIAVYTGAKFIDKNQNMNIDHLEMTDFGKAEKIVVNKDDVFIIKGKGEKEEIKKRIEKLKSEREVEKTDMFKKKIERRIASLAGGVGLIEVAAYTEGERDYLMGKVEDAVMSCRTALEEGIVKGGGMALKEIDDKLPKDDILKDILKVPYEKIKENAGEADDWEIDEKIVDSVKMIRVALENACSFAGVFCETETAMAWKKSKLADELGEMIKEKNEE